MRPTKLTTICAIAVLTSFGALADDGHGGPLNNRDNNGNGAFESTLVGSVPNTTVGGVASGGAPWVVSRSRAFVSGNGRSHVAIRGLLITSGPGVSPTLVGTVGPVTMVGASLVCGGSGGSVVASSDGTPLSADGNAEIDTTVTLPASCSAPVVLIRIFTAGAPTGSQLGRFIALSGFTAGQPANNNNNNDNGDPGDHD